VPEDLPPVKPYQEMNKLMAVIFDLMEQHKDDCDKAVVEVEAYAKKHRAAMVALSKEITEQVGKLSDADRRRFKAWTMSEGQLVLKHSMGTMMAFHQKCPDQMQRINKQVLSLTSN
jgi:hypothetical protein